VLHDLDVPNYADAPLGASQIVLASMRGLLKATANVDQDLKQVITLPPTAERVFMAGDEVTAFAELYDNRKQTKEPITLLLTVSDDGGRIVFRTEEELHADAFDAIRKAYRHTTSIPVKQLAPGDYVLRLTALPRNGSRADVTREVAFSVRNGNLEP
jgi:hypothetical protein